MKRKIFITLIVVILFFSFQYPKAFAQANIKENISGRFPHYDVTAEYRVEIKDSTNKKITIKFKDMTIIESYIETSNGKLDLKSLSKITYSKPNDTYFLYVEDITNTIYQLDYSKPYQYSIYLNDKLKKEVKTANSSINKAKQNTQDIYYTFYITYDKIADTYSQASIFGIKIFIIFYIIFFIIYVYYFFYGIRHFQGKRHGGIVNEKDINYCRELPKFIDLENAYAGLYYCSKISTKKLKNGIIGAFILKWSKDGNILIADKGTKVFSIDLKDGNFKKTELEQELYDILKMAAGNNNIIDNTELKVWSRSHKNVLKSWYNKLLSNTYNDNFRPEAEALLGLKKFLLDYSLIEERKHIEIYLWENYLIYAQLLGISEEVTKQFSKIYPDYSKLGQLSVMKFNELLNELIMDYVSIIIFLIPVTGFTFFVSIIFSLLYYIFHLL